MIPDEAVEAAMKHFPPLYRSVVIAALKSAAPLMLAEAWDEGHEAGKSDAFAHDKGFTGYHPNPYRSQA